MEEYEYHDDNWDWNWINKDAYDYDDEERIAKYGVGCNPDTPKELLIELSEDEDWFVRYEVTINPNIPQDILIALSKDGVEEVRSGVAKNLNTPKEVFIELSKDEKYEVRSGVAKNPNTPIEILQELINDKDSKVKKFALKNMESIEKLSSPNVAKEVLITLSKDESWGVRYKVARNPNAPKEVLFELSRDEDYIVRMEVASNPNTPIEILQELSNEEYSVVKEIALKNMEKLSDPSHQSRLIEEKMISNTITLDNLLKEKGYDRDSGVGKELVALYNDTQDKLKTELEELKSKVVDIAISDFNNDFNGR